MKLNSLLVAIFMLVTSVTYANQESEYLDFFNRYQMLGDNFDIAVANLYSDDAEIIAVRTMPDGAEQTLKVDGKKWKQMIIDSMEIGKQRGDKSEFSDVTISVKNNKARISASRYAFVKCFNDTRYYMIVSKNKNGELQILKESMESPRISKCDNTANNDLALVLQGTAKMTNKQLPIMVDDETKLERVSSEGNTLTYHYELVNYISTELDADALAHSIKPMVTQQTCSMAKLKSILYQGGSVSYQYNGKDKKPILIVNINNNSCN